MLQRDSLHLSKYAIVPEIDENFDYLELPDFGFRADIDPDLHDIDLDDMDDDSWGAY